MTPDDLAEIRLRCADPARPSRDYYLEHYGAPSYIFHDYDAVPRLLDEIERLRAALREAGDELHYAAVHADDEMSERGYADARDRALGAADGGK